MADSLRSQTSPKADGQPVLTFRGRYIILPCVALILSLTLAAYFYGLLPAEVGYHFADGEADRFAGRGPVTAVLIVPQLVFTVAAVALVGGTVALSRRYKGADTGLIGGVMLVMGNMVALPQLVLVLAMLDIFLFNACRVHIPFLAAALTIMGIGVILLGLLFIFAIRRSLARNRAAVGTKERANV